MVKFAWLWMFALLPLPIVVRMVVPKSDEIVPSLKVPFFSDLSKPDLTTETPSRISLVLAVVIWIALVTAVARPLWIKESVSIPVTGRDILLALDISGSMDQQDFASGGLTRFEAVREIAGDFVQRRRGDRVGLILFGSRPYLYAPLTFDVDTVVDFLSTSNTGFAGQRTAIGDAIGLSVKVLRERSAENRILILLTDGENSAGSIDPLQAMQLAVEHSVRIFVIGIGPDPRLLSGQVSGAANVLSQVAQNTGGIYFHASSSRELENIYETIDAYEPVEADEKRRTIAEELYPWPLTLSMIALFLLVYRNSGPWSNRGIFRRATGSANSE